MTDGRNAASPRTLPGGAGAGSALAALLAPYADHTAGQLGRVVDVPPPVAATALQLLTGDQVAGRCNGAQPPMSWLQQRAAGLGGRLVGSVWRGYVRFDGVQVPARPLAERVAADWPATPTEPATAAGSGGRGVADLGRRRAVLDRRWSGPAHRSAPGSGSRRRPVVGLTSGHPHGGPPPQLKRGQQGLPWSLILHSRRS